MEKFKKCKNCGTISTIDICTCRSCGFDIKTPFYLRLAFVLPLSLIILIIINLIIFTQSFMYILKSQNLNDSQKTFSYNEIIANSLPAGTQYNCDQYSFLITSMNTQFNPDNTLYIEIDFEITNNYEHQIFIQNDNFKFILDGKEIVNDQYSTNNKKGNNFLYYLDYNETFSSSIGIDAHQNWKELYIICENIHWDAEPISFVIKNINQYFVV